MDKNLKFVSLADSAFEKLENEILSGKYEKGEVLTETKLSELLEISRTPIREAVRRLEQEKLVKLTTKGILIVGLTEKDINDIYEIRLRIEGLATVGCAERMSEEEFVKLKCIVDLQEFYTTKNMPDDINQTDSKFHDYIFSHCGSDILSGVLSSLHRKIQKYRKISVQDNGRAVKAVEEHREIYNAMAQHDLDLAYELTLKHIQNARENIIKNIKK